MQPDESTLQEMRMTTTESSTELPSRDDPNLHHMQMTGPLTGTSDKWSFFNMNEQQWVCGRDGKWDPDTTHTAIKALVNQTDPNGFSLWVVKYLPNVETPHHTHDVAQTIFVLEGSVSLGNKMLGPGEGYFTPAGKPYAAKVGPEGCVFLEFRHSPLNFDTTWKGELGWFGIDDEGEAYEYMVSRGWVTSPKRPHDGEEQQQ
jgi:hypothetical protein